MKSSTDYKDLLEYIEYKSWDYQGYEFEYSPLAKYFFITQGGETVLTINNDLPFKLQCKLIKIFMEADKIND